MLQIENLEKSYGKKKVLQSMSFQLDSGEMVGIIGANGAGKTTLFKCMTGLVLPDSGNIIMDNKYMPKDRKILLAEIGAVIEMPVFYDNLTGNKNLKLEASARGIQDNAWINNLITWLSMDSYINEKVKTYSLGMRQRLGLCRALLNKPKWLFLDEPTNGLDIEGKLWLWKMLHQIREQIGTTVIVSSHSIQELEAEVSHFKLLKDGQIITSIDKEELQSSYLLCLPSECKERVQNMHDVKLLESNASNKLMVKVDETLLKNNIFEKEVISKRKWSLLDEYLLWMHDGKGMGN